MENPLNFAKDWDGSVEDVLKKISHNSGLCSEHHKKNYEILIHKLMWYKIPIIVISSINSVFSVGLTAYLEQNIVSTLTCLLSLTVGCISSIELYLSIQRRSDNELITYKQFYSLALKINTMLDLEPSHRSTEGDLFLTTCLAEYNTIFENGQVNGLGQNDMLVKVEL
jgi:hypothetical protein